MMPRDDVTRVRAGPCPIMCPCQGAVVSGSMRQVPWLLSLQRLLALLHSCTFFLSFLPALPLSLCLLPMANQDRCLPSVYPQSPGAHSGPSFVPSSLLPPVPCSRPWPSRAASVHRLGSLLCAPDCSPLSASSPTWTQKAPWWAWSSSPSCGCSASLLTRTSPIRALGWSGKAP